MLHAIPNLQKKAEHFSKRFKEKEMARNMYRVRGRQGYRLTTNHFKMEAMPFELDIEREVEIVKRLFLASQEILENNYTVQNEIGPFNEEKLNDVGGNIKNRKAPGPDIVPSDAIKIALKIIPEVILGVMNELVRKKEFPGRWKCARVVLIIKGGKPMKEITSFQTICLLDSLGKLYEDFVKNRISKELKANEEISRHQFGFRKG